MNWWKKKADAAGSDEIKSRFQFTIPNKSQINQKVTIFRDPLGLEMFRKVANQLRADGFQVTDAKPGMACVACFKIRCSEFIVVAILQAHRPAADIVDCSVSTWCLRPRWRRVSPEFVAEEWIRACAAIERILRENVDVSSLLWMTKNEAREREHEIDAMMADKSE